MITRQQAIDLFESDDLIGIAMEADAVRKKLHPERIVTYFLEAESSPSSGAFAPVVFGSGETIQQYVDRLESLYRIQEENHALTAVVPQFADATASEYLKALAISRICLHNVPHVQASWTTGLKICQIALRFGADDLCGSGGPQHAPTEEQLRCLIRDAGFIPKQRDALFQSYFLD